MAPWCRRLRTGARGGRGRESASCWSRRGAGVVALEPRGGPGVEGAGEQRVPRLPHEHHEEMYIVQRQEAEAEYLVGLPEVADVGAGEARAGCAVALRVDGALVRAELRAFDVEPAVAREHGAVAPHPRGGHA